MSWRSSTQKGNQVTACTRSQPVSNFQASRDSMNSSCHCSSLQHKVQQERTELICKKREQGSYLHKTSGQKGQEKSWKSHLKAIISDCLRQQWGKRVQFNISKTHAHISSCVCPTTTAARQAPHLGATSLQHHFYLLDAFIKTFTHPKNHTSSFIHINTRTSKLLGTRKGVRFQLLQAEDTDSCPQ